MSSAIEVAVVFPITKIKSGSFCNQEVEMSVIRIQHIWVRLAHDCTCTFYNGRKWRDGTCHPHNSLSQTTTLQMSRLKGD